MIHKIFALRHIAQVCDKQDQEQPAVELIFIDGYGALLPKQGRRADDQNPNYSLPPLH